MGKRLSTVGALTATAVAGIGLLLAPSASAAPAQPAQQSGKYCLTEVAPVAAGSRDLTQVKRTCSDTPAAGTNLPSNARVAADDLTLLVTFFRDQNYGGNYDTVGGRFGPCDAEGYRISDLRNVDFNVGGISSYKLASNCKRSSYNTGVNFSGNGRAYFRAVNVPSLGAGFDNDIKSIGLTS